MFNVTQKMLREKDGARISKMAAVRAIKALLILSATRLILARASCIVRHHNCNDAQRYDGHFLPPRTCGGGMGAVCVDAVGQGCEGESGSDCHHAFAVHGRLVSGRPVSFSHSEAIGPSHSDKARAVSASLQNATNGSSLLQLEPA